MSQELQRQFGSVAADVWAAAVPRMLWVGLAEMFLSGVCLALAGVIASKDWDVEIRLFFGVVLLFIALIVGVEGASSFFFPEAAAAKWLLS